MNGFGGANWHERCGRQFRHSEAN